MSGWMSKGFEGADQVDKEQKERAARKESGENSEDFVPWRLWMPPDTTKRILLVEDEPNCFWEHQFKVNGDWKHWEVCLKKNKIADNDPLCEAEEWPYYVGLLTGLDVTGYEHKKHGKMIGVTRIVPFKLGGKDKPGMLKEIKRLRSKYGRLRGMVFDAFRSGAKSESCGDRWEIVEQLEPTQEAMESYLKKQDGEYDAKRNPCKPLDFRKIIKPHTVAEIERHMRGKYSDSPSGDGAANAGGEAESGAEQDDGFQY